MADGWKLRINLIVMLIFLLSFTVAESVKALLGRHTKILVKYVVKLETKGDKTENRVLVSKGEEDRIHCESTDVLV